jgi:hypothetical protein
MLEFTSADQVEATSPLELLPTPHLASQIQVRRAEYRREIPTHYLRNPFTQGTVSVNVITVEGGSLFIPIGEETSFRSFFRKVKRLRPDLHQHIISPRGTAKYAANDQVTPIKELVALAASHSELPADKELYGWHPLASETLRSGKQLLVLFQGNGQYFNRGSAFFSAGRLSVQPDADLARHASQSLPAREKEKLGVFPGSLRRPLLFFLSRDMGHHTPMQFIFLPGESYQEGIDRLESNLLSNDITAGYAASPPLVVPGRDGNPIYLTLPEMITDYHANDVRHYLYCPYAGVVLLSAELSRAQSLQAEDLSRSISGSNADRLAIHLQETLNFVDGEKLAGILENYGYAGRYHFSLEGREILLHLNPLPGVYSHLVSFITRHGVFGFIQTSGTRGNITGNDGPTFNQLVAILADINRHPPFQEDPIVAAASGSQGNDVPNIVCLDSRGKPGLLSELCPTAALDDQHIPRGPVTTPRVGIVTS